MKRFITLLAALVVGTYGIRVLFPVVTSPYSVTSVDGKAVSAGPFVNAPSPTSEPPSGCTFSQWTGRCFDSSSELSSLEHETPVQDRASLCVSPLEIGVRGQAGARKYFFLSRYQMLPVDDLTVGGVAESYVNGACRSILYWLDSKFTVVSHLILPPRSSGTLKPPPNSELHLFVWVD
jgi:hypothetical protein